MKTTYNVYEHTTSGTPHVACESYSVPASLADSIDFITPTTHFDVHVKHPKPRRSESEAESALDKREAAVAPGLLKHKHKSPVSPQAGDEVTTPAKAGSTSGCDSQITPACLRSLYGINVSPSLLAAALTGEPRTNPSPCPLS